MRSHRFVPTLGALLIVILLAGCGSAAAVPTSTNTPTPPTATAIPPTATATPLPVATGPTCLPDPIGIYTGAVFVTTLNDAPGVSAPPETKHGIGSSGTANGKTQGGESGVCTVGSNTTIAAFYTAQLAGLGWSASAPPSALATACNTSASGSSAPVQLWWKANSIFTWYAGTDAGGGSIFWSYGYCATGVS